MGNSKLIPNNFPKIWKFIKIILKSCLVKTHKCILIKLFSLDIISEQTIYSSFNLKSSNTKNPHKSY
jgi:hypothetical protein